MPKRTRYTEEQKAQVVARMSAPDAPSILQLARELKISEPTLYAWKKEALGTRKTNSLGDMTKEPSAMESRVKRLERELAEKEKLVVELGLALLRAQGIIGPK